MALTHITWKYFNSSFQAHPLKEIRTHYSKSDVTMWQFYNVYKHNAESDPKLYETFIKDVQKLIQARDSKLSFIHGESSWHVRQGRGALIFQWSLYDTKVHETIHPIEYNDLVTAILIRAKYIFEQNVSIDSEADWVDWIPGRILYQQVFDQDPVCPLEWHDENPPDTIKAYYCITQDTPGTCHAHSKTLHSQPHSLLLHS